jgi:predicted lipase
VANVVSTLHTLQFTSEELHLLVKAVENHYLLPADDNEGEIDSAFYDLRDALQKPIMADYQVKWLERKVEYHKREVLSLKKAAEQPSAAS